MKGIKDAQRIVVKVGTSTLTYDTGKVNLRRMDKLAQVISDLRNSGIEVALVTSAAIAVGVGKLGLPARPKEISDELMAIADTKGSTRGTGGMVTKLHAAQIATEAGIDTIVMNGAQPEDIYRLLDGRQTGTYFKAKA